MSAQLSPSITPVESSKDNEETLFGHGKKDAQNIFKQIELTSQSKLYNLGSFKIVPLHLYVVRNHIFEFVDGLGVNIDEPWFLVSLEDA